MAVRTKKATHLWVEGEALANDIVLLLAVHDPMSQAELAQILATLGVRDAAGRKHVAAALKGPLDALLAEGRICVTRYQGRHSIPEAQRWEALDAGVASGRLSALADVVFEDYAQRVQYLRSNSVACVRMALLGGRPEGPQLVQDYVAHYGGADIARRLTAIVGTAPPVDWLKRVPRGITVRYGAGLCADALAELTAVGEAPLKAAASSIEPATVDAACVAVLKGAPLALDKIELSAAGRADVEAFAHFYAGNLAAAVEVARRGAQAVKGNKHPLPSQLALPRLVMEVVSSAHAGDALTRLRALADMSRARDRDPFESELLDRYVEALSGAQVWDFEASDLEHAHWDELLAAGLLCYWSPSTEVPGVLVAALRLRARAAEERGYPVAARHLSETVDVLEGAAPAEGSLAAAFQPRAAWEMALTALMEIAAAPAPAEKKADSSGARLVFELVFIEGRVGIVPRRFASARARVSKRIAVNELLIGEHPYLTDADRALLALSTPVFAFRGRRKTEVGRVLGREALPGLIGHPAVIDEAGAPLRVVRGDGELRAERAKQGAGTRVFLHPAELQSEAVVAVPDGAGQVVVYERSEELTRIAGLLAHGPLEVPAAGEARLGEVLGRLSERVRVGAGQSVVIEGKEVAPELRLALLCRFRGERLEVRLRAIPLGLDGPHLVVGQGPAQVMAVVDGSPLRTSRDLVGERGAREALFADAPALGELSWQDDTLVLEGLEAALDFLCAVGDLGEARCVLAWPDGERLPTPIRRDVKDLKVTVGEAKDWLQASVALPVDDARVLHFSALLARTEGGRYVRLDDGSYVALTAELARRVDALAALGSMSRKGDAVEASPVLLPRLVELTADVGDRRLDRAAAARLRALEAALSANIEPPSGFQASLRDYQEQGYVWMARLAEAGLGACLADDMGLGKTVQTLALLARRAKLGAALVVAPTSVVSAWVTEASRFAPQLELVVLADEADRRERLAGAAAGQLFVTSYGVLVTEATGLAETRFSTVVFDEAHLLKNARTQRAKAAAALDAGFRLALTGTPVENHLGELWSLMRVVLPGLLGSEKEFGARFMDPIGRGERAALAGLRALLRPFLLRRTKAEVLDELPERSETTLLVDPGPDERAYYQALRARALERVADDEGGAGQARVRLLAEITRLRQAAVDPRLLDAAEAPRGEKLELLAERVVSLRDEGHKPLIFTQFLGSLALIEARLSAAGLRILTLDGSLSAKERAARVAAFQAGEADAFVMSLHAGGVGITLTAADYVFHVDPWWNPAVEEQATGRAHRIGQRRPVHVYRLITAGSIEEKILALHKTKRQLVGDLLSGLDEAKKLDLDTLKGLLA